MQITDSAADWRDCGVGVKRVRSRFHSFLQAAVEICKIFLLRVRGNERGVRVFALSRSRPGRGGRKEEEEEEEEKSAKKKKTRKRETRATERHRGRRTVMRDALHSSSSAWSKSLFGHLAWVHTHTHTHTPTHTYVRSPKRTV